MGGVASQRMKFTDWARKPDLQRFCTQAGLSNIAEAAEWQAEIYNHAIEQLTRYGHHGLCLPLVTCRAYANYDLEHLNIERWYTYMSKEAVPKKYCENVSFLRVQWQAEINGKPIERAKMNAPPPCH